MRDANRFGRASYYINACQQSTDAGEAVAPILSVMHNVSVTRGIGKKMRRICHPRSGSGSPSQIKKSRLLPPGHVESWNAMGQSGPDLLSIGIASSQAAPLGKPRWGWRSNESLQPSERLKFLAPKHQIAMCLEIRKASGRSLFACSPPGLTFKRAPLVPLWK
jgi:hypothetical protein